MALDCGCSYGCDCDCERVETLNECNCFVRSLHLGVDFKLPEAPLQQLLFSSRHLHKVGGVEGEPLVIGTRQLTSKGQLIGNGGKIWQILQVVEGAPGEDVACHPAGERQRFQCGVLEQCKVRALASSSANPCSALHGAIGWC